MLHGDGIHLTLWKLGALLTGWGNLVLALTLDVCWALQVIGNKWDTYLDLLQADYTEGCVRTPIRSAPAFVAQDMYCCVLRQRRYESQGCAVVCSPADRRMPPTPSRCSLWQGCVGLTRACAILLPTNAHDTRGSH
jgi:hypothetical protein